MHFTFVHHIHTRYKEEAKEKWLFSSFGHVAHRAAHIPMEIIALFATFLAADVIRIG